MAARRNDDVPSTQITEAAAVAADAPSTPPPRRPSIDSKSLAGSYAESYVDVPPPSPGVPKLPETMFDATLSLEQIIAEAKIGDTDVDPKKKEMVEKRASNVFRLAQESEKLNAELKALGERLRAAEERTRLIEQRRREQEARDRANEQAAQVVDETSTAR